MRGIMREIGFTRDFNDQRGLCVLRFLVFTYASHTYSTIFNLYLSFSDTFTLSKPIKTKFVKICHEWFFFLFLLWKHFKP